MRIISTILFAAVVGVLVGAAVAYVEVRSDLDPITQLPGDKEASPRAANEKFPRVQVDEARYEFGTMQRGTSKTHEFVVRNVGTATLKLRKGTATCKCTEFVVPEDPIPPGGSTKVRVEWSAKSDGGAFRQTATVFTNDPLQSQVELNIDGQIMAVSGVEPPDLIFDKIPVGESKTSQVYVMAMLQDELIISDPEFSDPATRDYFEVKIEPVEREVLPNKLARRGVRLTVTAKPGLPVGRFHQWLSIRTNLPEAEKLEIPALGQVVGDISVHGIGWNEEQGALVMPNVKSSEGRRAKVNVAIRGSDAANVKFSVQSVDPPELKVTIGEPKKLKETLVHVPVEIEVPAGTRPMVRLGTDQGEAGRIVLSTTHPKIKELAIGVRFTVER